MSTDSPSTTDRLAEIRTLVDNLAYNTPPWQSEHHRFGTDINFGDHYQVNDADGDLVAVTDYEPVADLLVNAAPDLEFLLSLVDSLQERLDTAEGWLAEVRENQLGLARGFLHDAEAQHQRSGNAPGSDFTAVRAAGTAHGAVSALQILLVETGEVEYDEEADAVWELVSRKDGEEPSDV